MRACRFNAVPMFVSDIGYAAISVAQTAGSSECMAAVLGPPGEWPALTRSKICLSSSSTISSPEEAITHLSRIVHPLHKRPDPGECSERVMLLRDQIRL